MVYAIGLSTCGKEINEDLFRAYREAGITCAEITMNYDRYPDADYRQIARDAQIQGISLTSMHLPFGPFHQIDISSTDEFIRSSTIVYLTRLMVKASQAGIHRFVIHPSGEPIDETERPARMACARQSLQELADIAAVLDSVIAVENLPRTCLGRDSGEMLELLSADPRLVACFDTNHLLSEDPVVFIRNLAGRIATTHVSDYDLVDEKHWLPGEGKCDWTALVKALEEADYAGPWMYELSFKAPATLPRSRDLICADFARNANEVLSGSEITRII